ncbi:wiskott-Aldrich syndrome protein homolog isoform X4 [Canis lupus familiaris]|uniref:wiskott-Aldrich syndrome protein homolog isoform X4 n=1 Tax=Canis lupus familiaris TaxID=9615 RepID=UPI0018F48DB4|nr:wiskott-Aldrich syndrome protein homolog isoform X4 [Canis lupus familiaris]
MLGEGVKHQQLVSSWNTLGILRGAKMGRLVRSFSLHPASAAGGSGAPCSGGGSRGGWAGERGGGRTGAGPGSAQPPNAEAPAARKGKSAPRPPSPEEGEAHELPARLAGGAACKTTPGLSFVRGTGARRRGSLRSHRPPPPPPRQDPGRPRKLLPSPQPPLPPAHAQGDSQLPPLERERIDRL